MSDGQLVCVGLDMLYWDYVEPRIQEALNHDYGRLTTADIKSAIESGNMQLWAIHDGQIKAVIVTEILSYPCLKLASAVTVTGENMEEWLDMFITTMSAWAKQNGCDGLSFNGRIGWLKVLKQKGFHTPQLNMVKFLTP